MGGRLLTVSLPACEISPTDHTAGTFVETLKQAAVKSFTPMTYAPRTPWIQQETLHLLEKAKQAEANLDPQAKSLRLAAKRQAKKDRVTWVHNQLMQDPVAEHSTVWKTARRQKQGFRARKQHLLVQSKPVPWSKTHEAPRDHLQNSHSPTTEANLQELRERPPLRPQLPSLGPITLEETQASLKKLKQNKALGPDLAVNELLVWLDTHGEEQLTKIFQDIWVEGCVPDKWKHASVVMIYKGKGLDTDPANYRPISLLNTMCKLFASILQTRISSQLDGSLRRSQYGFRQSRGTRHALHLLRRAMEFSDFTDKPLHLLFLDWKQAFDSVVHNTLLIDLRRFGISEDLLALIHSIYDAPTFEVKGLNGVLAQGEVRAGIRQGCPLSPYLFIMVLTVLLEDVDQALLRAGIPTNTWSVNRPIFDVEYADDTLLLGVTIPQLQSILHQVETEAALYGMTLNADKTELLYPPDHTAPTMNFLNGSKVPTSTQVKYLGSMVSWKHSFGSAFKHRSALAEQAYKKLRLVWNSSLPLRTKLRIFQATFPAVLTYGLDAFTLTDKILA